MKGETVVHLRDLKEGEPLPIPSPTVYHPYCVNSFCTALVCVLIGLVFGVAIGVLYSILSTFVL